MGPKVLGLAAIKGPVARLRGHTTANLVGGVRHLLALNIPQSGQFLRDFVYLGFKRSDAGARVFRWALGKTAPFLRRQRG